MVFKPNSQKKTCKTQLLARRQKLFFFKLDDPPVGRQKLFFKLDNPPVGRIESRITFIVKDVCAGSVFQDVLFNQSKIYLKLPIRV